MAGLVSDVESRLRALEDRAAIADLIASYGPMADSGDGAGIGALWADDGSYTFDQTTLRHPHIAGLVELDTHRALMAAGCAHVLSAPTITIDGDTALALTHSVVLEHSGEAWSAVRVSANRWTLERTDAGWKVSERVNRLLTGAAAARELLTP